MRVDRTPIEGLLVLTPDRHVDRVVKVRVCRDDRDRRQVPDVQPDADLLVIAAFGTVDILEEYIDAHNILRVTIQ